MWFISFAIYATLPLLLISRLSAPVKWWAAVALMIAALGVNHL